MTDNPLNARQSKPKILRVIIDDLIRRSQRTRRPAARDLSGGASLLVVTRDGEVRLLVARKGQPLGDVELRTFAGYVPAGATRWPKEGQNLQGSPDHGWTWRVGWKWTVEEECALT